MMDAVRERLSLSGFDWVVVSRVGSIFRGIGWGGIIWVLTNELEAIVLGYLWGMVLIDAVGLILYLERYIFSIRVLNVYFCYKRNLLCKFEQAYINLFYVNNRALIQEAQQNEPTAYCYFSYSCL